MLVPKLSDPPIESFNFLEGDQVCLSQKLDDSGLVALHARIVVAVARPAHNDAGRPMRRF
jgi:hypothetical protein